MIPDIINQFRKECGVKPAKFDLYDQNSYCLAHCIAMAERGHLYHAEPHLLGDFAEAVAMCECVGDWGKIERSLIYDILGSSEQHKQVLLKDELACGLTFHDNKVWITVRGRDNAV